MRYIWTCFTDGSEEGSCRGSNFLLIPGFFFCRGYEELNAFREKLKIVHGAECQPFGLCDQRFFQRGGGAKEGYVTCNGRNQSEIMF